VYSIITSPAEVPDFGVKLIDLAEVAAGKNAPVQKPFPEFLAKAPL
jgi:hypothetical protein